MKPLLALLLVIGFSGSVSGQDFEETKRLAEQGDAFSQYNMGFMYANGIGSSHAFYCNPNSPATL